MFSQASRRKLSSSKLPWAPPALVNPRLVTVTADPATRYIELSAGEDCQLSMPQPVSYVPNAFGAAEDGIVTVVGGRNVTLIGGEIHVDRVVKTTLTAPAGADDMTITVADTSLFPPSGMVRIDGEGITYDSKTATTLNVTARRFGFYLGTATLPNTPHSAGATVYLGEYHRTGISFRSQTGYVHAEGLKIHGGGLLDGFRLRGSGATTATLQNSRIGPNGPSELVSMQDGHADCVQTWGSGVNNLRMSHLTLRGGVSGRCIINAANTSGGGAVGLIRFQDSECVDHYGRRLSLVTNSDTETPWIIANSWLRTAQDRLVAAPELGRDFQLDSPSGRDLIPEHAVGIGYVTPGYR